ncbi:MAG: Holliday junction resolvase RuvX [Chitinivibrionales bacterium]
MKLLGVDYGRRRIGIAVTDEQGEYIKGLPTLDRKKTTDFLRSLEAIISRQQPRRIVIGLPLDIDGHETVMSLEVRAFAEKLQAISSVPVSFVDESLTSVRAAGIMRFKKKKDRRDKLAVDRIAACLILEAFQKEFSCE